MQFTVLLVALNSHHLHLDQAMELMILKCLLDQSLNWMILFYPLY